MTCNVIGKKQSGGLAKALTSWLPDRTICNSFRGEFNKTFTSVIYSVHVAIVLESENKSFTCKLRW